MGFLSSIGIDLPGIFGGSIADIKKRTVSNVITGDVNRIKSIAAQQAQATASSAAQKVQDAQQAVSLSDLLSDLGLSDLTGGGGGYSYRPQTAEEAAALAAQAEAYRQQAKLYGAQTKLYGAQAADVPLARELERRTALADIGATQAELAANPRRIFEALYYQSRVKPTELAKSLQQKLTIPGFKKGGKVKKFISSAIKRPGRLTEMVGGKPGEHMDRVREIAENAENPRDRAAARFFLNVLSKLHRSAEGKTVEGPVLSLVGRHDDEYALLPPGSVLAPKPEGEKATVGNALSAIVGQMREGGVVSQKKAKKILRHGSVRGHPLTERQIGLFGLIAGGGTPTKLHRAQGGIEALGVPQSVQDEYERQRKAATETVLGATKKAVGGTSLFDALGGGLFTEDQAGFLRKMNARQFTKLSPTQKDALYATLSAGRVNPEDFLELLQRGFEGLNPVEQGTRARFAGILGR